MILLIRVCVFILMCCWLVSWNRWFLWWWMRWFLVNSLMFFLLVLLLCWKWVWCWFYRLLVWVVGVCCVLLVWVLLKNEWLFCSCWSVFCMNLLSVCICFCLVLIWFWFVVNVCWLFCELCMWRCVDVCCCKRGWKGDWCCLCFVRELMLGWYWFVWIECCLDWIVV